MRSKLEAQPADSVSDASPGLGALPPLPVADVTLHADDSASDPDSSGTHPLRYWLAVGGAAGLIAALIGLLALLPMSVR